jgi:hypothetical protein
MKDFIFYDMSSGYLLLCVTPFLCSKVMPEPEQQCVLSGRK